MAIGSAFAGVVAGLCMGVIGMALTRVPPGRLANALRAAVLAGITWIMGDLLADAATTAAGKRLALAVMYTGTIAVAPLWWWVVVRWAESVEPERPALSPLWTRGPLAWAALMWLAMITNPWHETFITPVVGARNVYEPAWYAMAVPAWGMAVAALALELSVWQRARRRNVRRQAQLLVGASLVGLGGNLWYTIGLAPFNPTALTLLVAGVLLAVGIARDGLFGAVPAALPAIAAEHPDGVVITGADGCIEFANRRAEELLDPIPLRRDVSFAALLRDERLHPDSALDLARANDQTWWNALAGLHGVPFDLQAERPRSLHVTASALRGRRGRLVGWSLRISDRSGGGAARTA